MDTLAIIGIIFGAAGIALNGTLAVVAILSLRDNHKQIQEGKEQARLAQAQTVEAQQDLHRPLLILLHGQQGTTLTVRDRFLEYNAPSQYIVYKNVGSGLATNIQGWIYGYIPEDHATGQAARYEFAAEEPLPKEEVGKGYNARANTVLFAFKDKIGDYGLSAPKGMVARVTLTYHDIFNNKHAAIFDLSSDGRWISRGFPKIDKDLADLGEEIGKRMVLSTQALYDATAQLRAHHIP